MDSPLQPNLAPWKIRASRYLIDRPHLRLRADTVELPDGTIVEDYLVRETLGYSLIFAVTPDHNVVLVRQYKHGNGKQNLELPGGSIDPGETPHDCAVRELAEETGYVGESVEQIGAFHTDATGSNGRFYLFAAHNVRPQVAQSFDPTEQIIVELASLSDVHNFVRSGQIDGNSHVAAILYAFDKIASGALRFAKTGHDASTL